MFCYVWIKAFKLILLRLLSLVSKSVFVTKFPCANLAEKCSAGGNIFIMIMISNFLFNLWYFCVIIFFFLTKLLIVGILFSTVFSAGFMAKPLGVPLVLVFHLLFQ